MRVRDNTLTTRKYIMDSLLILLKDQSYSSICIGEITDKAGVNRSTYYRNFISKEDIIKQYYELLLFEFHKSISYKKDNDLNHYLFLMFSYFYLYRDNLLLLHRHSLSYLLLDALNDKFLNEKQYYYFEDKFSIYYHTGGIFNTFLLWFQNDMLKSPQEMTEYSLKVLPENFIPLLNN